MKRDRLVFATVVVALVVGTAGCLGALGVDEGDGETPTPNPDSTSTPSTPGGGSDGPIAEPPLDVTAVGDAHRERLRTAGSFTRHRDTNITEVGSGTSRSTSRTGRYDLDRGTAVVEHSQSLNDRMVYLDADGDAYERIGGEGGQFHGPDLAMAPNLTAAVDPAGLELANLTDLTYAGEGTREGASGHVYEASGVDTLDEGALEEFDAEGGSVTEYEMAFVLSEDGLVKWMEYTLAVETDQRTVRLTEQVRYEGVGSTDVSPPDWLEEAKAVAERPGPTDVVTERFASEGEDGQVEMFVTAKKHSLEESRALGPTVSENPIYRNEFLDAVRVGEIVRAYWLAADGVQQVQVRFHYDESEVPREESDLTVVYDDREEPLLQRLDSTVDPGNDTVTATIDDPDRLEELQGKTMFVVDYEEYVQSLEEQSSRRLRGDTGGVRSATR